MQDLVTNEGSSGLPLPPEMFVYSPWEGTLVNIATTGISIVAAWGILRLLDFFSRKKFGRDFFPVLEKSSIALSFYLSVRFASVLAFVAYQLGRYTG